MDEYETDQVILSMLLTFIFGFVALYSSSKAKDDNNSVFFNYKRNALIVGYVLITAAIFQAIGLLFIN